MKFLKFSKFGFPLVVEPDLLFFFSVVLCDNWSLLSWHVLISYFYGSAVEEKPSQRYEFIQAAIVVLTDTRNWSLSISIDHTEPTVSSWKL